MRILIFKTFVFFLVFAFVNISALSQIKIGGSYDLAAICKDGIVIAADSRGTFLQKDAVMAYFDTVQKVFPIKNCIVSVMGLIALNNRFISNYLKEFELTLPNNLTPDTLLMRLYLFFKQKYPAVMNDFARLHIICAGYKSAHANLCALDHGVRMTCVTDTATMSGDSLSQFKKYTREFCASKSCKYVGQLMEKAIRNYIKKYRKGNEIGGPIMIIKISRAGNIEWIENKPTKSNWETANDFMKDFLNHKVTINFLSDDYKKIIYKTYNLPMK